MLEFKCNGRTDLYLELNKTYKTELALAKTKFRNEQIQSAVLAKDARKLFQALRLLSGMPRNSGNSFVLPGDEKLSNKLICNKLAEYFSSISQEFPTLELDKLPTRVKN